jgi:hypothetical protein
MILNRHIRICCALLLTLSVSLAATAAVIVTDSELAAARTRIEQEPLRSYVASLKERHIVHAAPVLYLLTGEERHAEFARTTTDGDLAFLRAWMPKMVNIWILRSPGRVVSALLNYDMTRDSGVWTDADARDLRDYLGHVIDHYMGEGTDHLSAGSFPHQTDFIPADMEIWVIANMNVHRLLAVALYGLVFPDDRRSEELLDYTEAYVERILSLGSREGGAWAENPRYAGGVLRELYLIAAGLKNAGRRDFFTDDRFTRMLRFFAESIPTPGIEHPHKPTMLAAADSHWWENRGAILAWAAPRFRAESPDTPGNLMWAWRALGEPLSPESLLFADVSIPSNEPDYGSYLPGMGYVVFRDNFAEPDESFLFATFGPELGTSNKTMHHQPNHGDFSMIWRGWPIMLTRGVSSYVWSRRMRDQTPWSNSVVTYDGAGESIIIPEQKYAGLPVPPDTRSLIEQSPDHYANGVTGFVAADTFDYAAGTVRNWSIGLPAPYNRRHFLYLKPDVLVMWDRVRSTYPLQWNMHLPAEDVTHFGNRIDVRTPDGVDLAIDFLQDEPLDCTIDWPQESIRADWPLVMSCPYGKGMFVFNALDIARQALTDDHKGAGRILRNCLDYPEPPARIGLVATDGQMRAVLDRFGYDYDLLTYDDLGGDLSRFDRIVIGHFAVLVRDRDMIDHRQHLWEYVARGGVCYWGYQYAWGWLPGDTWGPGYFPHPLMVGEGTSILWGEGVELHHPVATDDSPIWRGPNRIDTEDWLGWQVGKPDSAKVMPVYAVLPNTDRARNIPVWHSDAWRVHASVRKSYNITPPATRPRFGPYRWLKVHHEASEDFVAVLRPRKDGVPSDEPVLSGDKTDFTITQGTDTWRILLGDHPGTSAAMTAMRFAGNDKSAAVEFLLVDALAADIPGYPLRFDLPMTVHYDASSGTGTIETLERAGITLPGPMVIAGDVVNPGKTAARDQFLLTAGAYRVDVSGDTLTLTRTAHLAKMELSDSDGDPIPWAHVTRDLPGGRTLFAGATDEHGNLTIRWTGEERQRIVIRGEDFDDLEHTLNPGHAVISVSR